jgi:hypothetical protein
VTMATWLLMSILEVLAFRFHARDYSIAGLCEGT